MKKIYTLVLLISLIQSSAFSQGGWFMQNPFPGVHWASVFFIDESTGWIVGNATIIKTTNSGENWNIQSEGINGNFTSVHFTSPSTGWVVGYSGLMLKTTNGGENWISHTTGNNDPHSHVHFTSPSTGWIIGSGIKKTTNGGTDWIQQSSNGNSSFFSAFFVSPSTGWVVGITGLPSWGAISKTTNGGLNWISQEHGGCVLCPFSSVYFTSSSTGWVVGGLLKTTDGGENWTTPPFFGYGGFNSVVFTSSSTGFIAGEQGLILKTTNSGMDWIPQSSGTRNQLLNVFFATPSTGWAVGRNGTILKTTNGGIAPINLNLTALIEGFYNENSNTMTGDTIDVYLRNSSSPYELVDSAKKYLDPTGYCTLSFFNAANDSPYYIEIRHRNSIETWSDSAVSFTSNSLTYDFTTAASQSYGNNLILKGTEYCIYSGDVNQDGYVDLTDINLVYNDANIFSSEYLRTDLTGDNNTNLTDLIITYNNLASFVSVIKP